MDTLTTDRLIAFLPKPGGSASQTNLRAVAGAEALVEVAGLDWSLAFAPRDSRAAVTLPSGCVATLYHRPPHAPAVERGQTGRLPDVAEDWRRLGAFNRLSVAAGQLVVESDPLGLAPLYYAELPGGHLLASYLADLFRVSPESIRPLDSVGLAGLLAFRAPMGDRTLHAAVRRFPTGAALRWTSHDGWGLTRPNRLVLPDADPSLSAAAACREIKSAILVSLRDRIPSSTPEICLPLSGGFDSRLLAAVSRDAGLPVMAYTYGHAHHREVQVAARVAKALGIRHEVLPYPRDNFRRRMGAFVRTVEGQADPSTLQIANLLGIPDGDGKPLLHGFIGDVLAGAHLTWLSDESLRDNASIGDGLLHHFLRNAATPPEAYKHLGLEPSTVRHEMHAALATDGPAYRRLIQWDLENRQRRFIASHFGLLSERFSVVAPYYAPGVIDAWLSVPRIALDGRQMLRTLMAREYPRLAEIPHAEEAKPIVANLRNEVLDFVQGIPDKVRRSIPGVRDLTGRWRPGRNTDIWALAYGFTPALAVEVRDAIVEKQDVLERVLGITLPGPSLADALASAALLRCFYALASYASHLEAAIAGSGKA